LNASGGLEDLELPSGQVTKAVLLPFTMNGQRLHIRLSPPQLGEHSHEILKALGYEDSEIDSLTQQPTLSKS
jgi:crotonobetainyl-CoA:carnitine CoA-transferase CaiB-like acyl-CoA transferase